MKHARLTPGPTVRRLHAVGSAIAAAAAAVAALALAGPAAAHVEPSPATARAGSTVRFQLSVESENPRSPTVKVAVRVPAAVAKVAVPAKAGWRVALTRSGGRVAVVTWTATGAGIRPDGREPFAIVVSVPATAGTLVWPTVNTFRDGTADRWIGPADADFPAPVLKVTAR